MNGSLWKMRVKKSINFSNYEKECIDVLRYVPNKSFRLVNTYIISLVLHVYNLTLKFQPNISVYNTYFQSFISYSNLFPFCFFTKKVGIWWMWQNAWIRLQKGCPDCVKRHQRSKWKKETNIAVISHFDPRHRRNVFY